MLHAALSHACYYILNACFEVQLPRTAARDDDAISVLSSSSEEIEVEVEEDETACQDDSDEYIEEDKVWDSLIPEKAKLYPDWLRWPKVPGATAKRRARPAWLMMPTPKTRAVKRKPVMIIPPSKKPMVIKPTKKWKAVFGGKNVGRMVGFKEDWAS